MKKLVIFAVVVSLVVPAITYAGPTYGDVDYPADGIFGEHFGDGNPGSYGGWIDAEDGDWAIYHAYHPGVVAVVDVGGISCWQTVYTDGSIDGDSWIRYKDSQSGIEYLFDEFEITVTSVQGGYKFDFSGTATNAAGQILTFYGPGEINANWVTYNGVDDLEAICCPLTGYDQGGYLDLKATVVPVPGAVLLGGIGVGFVGWFRRRHSL